MPKRSLLILIFLLSLCYPLHAANGFKIVFLPFKIQTNQPVTPKTIFESAFINIYIKHQRLPESIRNLISSTQSKPVDDQMIRLVIQEFGDTYRFDNKGNGITNKGKSVKIDMTEFEKLISDYRICFDLEHP